MAQSKFSEDIRFAIYLKFKGKCGQCGSTYNLQIHHIVHNTITNRKIYGDKVQSIDNGYLCCGSCHNKYSLWDRDLLRDLLDKWNAENN